MVLNSFFKWRYKWVWKRKRVGLEEVGDEYDQDTMNTILEELSSSGEKMQEQKFESNINAWVLVL